METTRSTVLLCRVTNQTIVCSRTGHGRGRERRSHIDPREHQQLITQIYVPIVHCLCTERLSPRASRADRSMEATGWPIRLGLAEGPAADTRRRENDGTKRRREEIKGGPSEDRSDPGAYRRGECEKSEEPSGRTTGRQPRPLPTCSVFYSFGVFSSLVQLRTRVIIIEYAGYTDVVYHDTLPNVSMDDTVVRYVITERYLEVVIMSTLLVKV